MSKRVDARSRKSGLHPRRTTRGGIKYQWAEVHQPGCRCRGSSGQPSSAKDLRSLWPMGGRVSPDTIGEPSSSLGADGEPLLFSRGRGSGKGRSSQSRESEQCSQPARASAEEIPGEVEIIFGTRVKGSQEVVQEGLPMQTEPGGGQAGHNHGTRGQCPASPPLPAQHSNFEVIQ